ncbi:MAG: helix-turn-helix domain-containing protein [Spartobacteria bacterium]
MEPLGQKLQQVRLAKNISLEEAARVTKIRAARIQEIEAEDFSSFSSLAYAKGFLLIYGKYLGVNVTPYLDAFETSGEVSVDGYSYLQDAPSSAPPPIVRRQPAKKPALLPFIIAIGVLVIGLYLVKLLLDIQRIAPRTIAPSAVASATPQPTLSPAERIVAPRALPADAPPASEARVTGAPTAPSEPSATPEASKLKSTEPEVRRAQPVRPEDFATPPPAPRAPSTQVNQVQITPIQMTYVRVTVDNQTKPVFDDWLEPSHAPISFRGQHVTMKVLDRGAVQITKNGVALAAGDEDVTIE